MRHPFTIMAFVLILLSCKKENVDMQNSLVTDIANAPNKNPQKALPKRIWHAYDTYINTWDFFYTKQGEVDSIDLFVETRSYGNWRAGYKVYHSGNRIDSITKTSWGQVWDVLQNIKYENGLIVGADFFFNRPYNNTPDKWKIEYDKKKRPLNSPLGEKFYYDEKGQLVSYTHPYSPGRNASFKSDNKENPMHRIPDLNIILLNEYETAMAWYNPNNVTSITYTNGEKVEVNNTFDYFGNLIIRSYGVGSSWGSHQWNFVY
ncbi:MAG TPA: hypothetical protein VK166_11500 [Chitinophagaceae bacterium]|nr:hypothetical protein [Chitinophagaceae bacterium]